MQGTSLTAAGVGVQGAREVQGISPTTAGIGVEWLLGEV